MNTTDAGNSAGAIAERLARVRERIAIAAERARRDPASVRLVLASKTQSPEAVRAAYLAGARDFGENYVQEAVGQARGACGPARYSLASDRPSANQQGCGRCAMLRSDPDSRLGAPCGCAGARAPFAADAGADRGEPGRRIEQERRRARARRSADRGGAPSDRGARPDGDTASAGGDRGGARIRERRADTSRRSASCATGLRRPPGLR